MRNQLKLILLMLAILFPATAIAYDFEVDGIYYDKSGNNASVTYKSFSNGSYISDYSGSVTIPKYVTYNGITYTVTSIGGYAFYGCSDLIFVTIPNTVTTIGRDAFYSCSGLTNVSIPNSVNYIDSGSFRGCSGLTSITFPNSVTTISSHAFSGCSSLTSVYIGNSIVSIDYNAFSSCSELTSVNISDIVAWFNISFGSSDANPLYYANHLYLNGEEVKDLVIPDAVTSIGNYALYGCRGLSSVTIPNSVTSIGSSAFQNCTGLASVVVGNSINSIGNYAFSNCSKLKNLFWNAENCTSIGNNAFNYSLTSLQIGNGVENIPSGMPSLSMSSKKLVLPNSVKTIASGAFKGSCGSVVIGNRIENIAAGAFANGISVAYVTSSEPIACEEAAFVNPQTLYVPEGSKMKYFTSQGWSEFVNIIEESYVRANTIILNKSTAIMQKGSSLQLTTTILPSNATSSAVSWLSLNAAVATVNSSGKITAVSVGETDIVAMVDNVHAICHVTVTPVLVESLTLSDAQLTLEPNDMYTLTATVLPASADNQTLEWIIPENDAIVTQVVNNTRLNVGAVGSGSVPITVRTTDGSNLSATCTVNVRIVASSISLNKTSATLSENYTTQLRATVLPDDATNKTVSWTTSNSSVATVDNNGLVTAVSSGSASITATTTDGSNLNASCVVTVMSKTDFTFHIDDIEEFAGSTITIPVELDNNYNIGAFMFDCYYPEGFEIIDYTATDRLISGSTINGLNHAEEHYYRFISVNLSNNVIISSGSGPIITLTLEIPENAFGNYDISLKNIQIVPEGSKTVRPYDISATLTVKEKIIVLATSVQLNRSNAMLNRGETLPLLATVLPDDVTNNDVNWVSSDETVAIVDDNGLVTAISVGQAIITASTVDGTNLSASCEITVKDDLSKYDNYLSLNDTESYPGETIVIPIAMTNSDTIVSFQTDIFLPDELEIVQENGEYIIEASDRMTRTHSIVSNEVASGAVRVICYSSNYKPFNGSSGDDLLYITIKVAEDAMGDYCILLKNTLLTNSAFEEIVAPDVLANLKVKDYLMGDANNSGTVTVTDVVVTSQYVLEQNPYPFVFGAADVNSDGNITVTDVSRIAWMVLNPTQNIPRRAPVLWNNGDRMSGEGITLTFGETRTVSIALDNAMYYSAFQIDLSLPDGLIAGNFHLSDRADGHAFDVNTLANGKIRALCYSPKLSAIRGNKGAILTFDVTATNRIDDAIIVDGIELVTTDCQTIKLDAFAIVVNSSTAVNELAASKTIAMVEYYNISGQRLDRPESGVTLVVTTYTDGTRMTQKIIK